MPEFKVPIKVSVQGAESSKRKLKGVEGGLKQLGKSAALAAGGFLGARMLVQGFKAMVNASAKQELAVAKLNQVLKSTKGVAGVTSKEMQNMAASLQQVTRFGDETIMGAQSLMLTFTQVGKEVMPQAIETVLNMSEAMGTDLQSSTIQLGKALNDPVLGISALSRVGVQLTETQKGQIKSFTAMGDVASAQKVILGELETQFGGLAKATGETMAGSMDQMKNDMGDAAEVMGDILEPAVLSVSNVLSKAAKKASSFFGNFLKTFSDAETASDAANEANKKLTESLRILAEARKRAKEEGVSIQEAHAMNVADAEAVVLAKEKAEFEKVAAEAIQVKTTAQYGYQAALKGVVEAEMTEEDALVQWLNTQQLMGEARAKEQERIAVLTQMYPELAKTLGYVADEEERSKSAKQAKVDLMTQELKQAALVQGSAKDAMKAVVRAEGMEAAAGLISSILKTVPFPFNVVLAAGAGATAAGLIDKGLANFASGGDFVTKGPQMIMVGDNPGGRERVQVTPLSSPNTHGPTNQYSINVQAPLVDESVVDSIIPAIQKAQRLGTV